MKPDWDELVRLYSKTTTGAWVRGKGTHSNTSDLVLSSYPKFN